jgi:hypothetical protein
VERLSRLSVETYVAEIRRFVDHAGSGAVAAATPRFYPYNKETAGRDGVIPRTPPKTQAARSQPTAPR